MENRLPRGSETIFLVDDEESLRAATTQILEHLGYEVIQAGSAEQALQMATTSSFHLLLMDVVLPQMSGLSLAHKIAAIHPGIRILYFSAYTSDRILDDQWEIRPGVGFLHKPFTAEAMARAVRTLLDEPIPPPAAPDPTPRGTEAILVVDDDPQTRRFMVKALERLGYHTLEAQDPERGLPIALRSRVDLVVADIERQGKAGLALAEALAGEKPHVRCLFVSGKAPLETEPETGAVKSTPTVLRKPFSPRELGEAVRKALDTMA